MSLLRVLLGSDYINSPTDTLSVFTSGGDPADYTLVIITAGYSYSYVNTVTVDGSFNLDLLYEQDTGFPAGIISVWGGFYEATSDVTIQMDSASNDFISAWCLALHNQSNPLVFDANFDVSTSSTASTGSLTTSESISLAVAWCLSANSGLTITPDTYNDLGALGDGFNYSSDAAYQDLTSIGGASETFDLTNSCDFIGAIITIGGGSGGGVTYTLSASGTITLSGTRVQSLTYSKAAAGTVTLSGSATSNITYTSTMSGTITLSGTVAQSLSVTTSRSGTETLSGTGSAALITSTPSGTETLSGAVAQNFTVSLPATGTATLSGTRVESLAYSVSPSTTLTLSGTSTSNITYTSTPSGTITLSGVATSSFPSGAQEFRMMTNFGT